MVLLAGQVVDLGLDELRDNPFAEAKGPARLPKTQLVIHESVTHDVDIVEDDGDRDDATERILRRKGCGVHFMIAPAQHDDDAAVLVQHNDLLDRLNHAGPLNAGSVAVEIINPYYPSRRRGPWKDAIPCTWAHKLKGERRGYVLPTRGQMARLWEVVVALTGVCRAGIEIPLTFPGLRGGQLRMGRLPDRDTRMPGVWAHHWDHHADGAFPVLYCALRSTGLPHRRAYAGAVDLARRAQRGWTPPLHTAEVGDGMA